MHTHKHELSSLSRKSVCVHDKLIYWLNAFCSFQTFSSPFGHQNYYLILSFQSAHFHKPYSTLKYLQMRILNINRQFINNENEKVFNDDWLPELIMVLNNGLKTQMDVWLIRLFNRCFFINRVQHPQLLKK